MFVAESRLCLFSRAFNSLVNSGYSCPSAMSHHEDSNPAPSAYKADALPDELWWQGTSAGLEPASLPSHALPLSYEVHEPHAGIEPA